MRWADSRADDGGFAILSSPNVNRLAPWKIGYRESPHFAYQSQVIDLSMYRKED